MRTNRGLLTVGIVVLFAAPLCVGCGAKQDAAPPPAPTAAAAPGPEDRMAAPSEPAAPSGQTFYYKSDEAAAPADDIDADMAAPESDGPALIKPGSGGRAVERDMAAASLESAAGEAQREAAEKLMMRRAVPKAAPKRVAADWLGEEPTGTAPPAAAKPTMAKPGQAKPAPSPTVKKPMMAKPSEPPPAASAPKPAPRPKMAAPSAPAARPKMAAAPPSPQEPKSTVSAPSGTSSQVVRTLPPPPTKPAPAAPPKPLTETVSAEGDYQVVKVYYGTDRAASEAGANEAGARWRRWTAIAAATTILLLLIVYVRRCGWLLKGLATAGVVATLALGAGATLLSIQSSAQGRPAHREYGNGRGSLELGTCEVSIPKTHEVGELEAPSIFRFEVQEDPEKHVVLLSVTPQSTDVFYDDLRACVAKSEKGEAFVFIHGYNVTFEKAARRTAQLAHDLKFDGAPIFYSWPSAAGLLSYAVDETNVAWTVPDLKQFLTDVARRSGASNVHLIAHSMGNRALTDALRTLSYELADNAKMFREVILTAPDIDAEIFRRDIVPAITKTAERVTLYASSNDEALVLSKKFHGYPRAGESGANIVVIAGIDTVDVSAIDTSLLGHSYYGENSTVLDDIIQVLKEAAPPERRIHLRLERLGALRYWIFARARERLGLETPEAKSK